MLEKLKEFVDDLPPKLKVFLLGLGAAVGTAVVDALFDALQPILTGAEAPSKASLGRILTLAIAAGLIAAKAYVKDSPMPRRIWTWQEREAERLAAEEKGK